MSLRRRVAALERTHGRLLGPVPEEVRALVAHLDRGAPVPVVVRPASRAIANRIIAALAHRNELDDAEHDA